MLAHFPPHALEDLRFVAAAFFLGCPPPLLDPDRDHVEYHGAELAAAAAVHEEDLIVVRDVEEFGQRGFGVVEDFGGRAGAVRDLGEGEAGVVVVEEGGGAGGEDGGGEGGGAGAEVGYFFAGWHRQIRGRMALSGLWLSIKKNCAFRRW